MQGRQLALRAAARAQELPGAELDHPFGPETDVYKVRGKVFMIMPTAPEYGPVTLKSAPEESIALRSAFPEITPGYHMNKRHWITLSPVGNLEPELVDDLVTESYLLVVEGLPRRLRPVDPELFGRRV